MEFMLPLQEVSLHIYIYIYIYGNDSNVGQA